MSAFMPPVYPSWAVGWGAEGAPAASATITLLRYVFVFLCHFNPRIIKKSQRIARSVLLAAGLTNPPSNSACDTCGAALFTAFQPTFEKFGASCAQLSSNPSAVTNAVTQAITPCVNVILPPLMQAGVPVNNLVILRSCPTTPGPALTAAIDKVCPNYSVQASSSG